MNDKHVLYTHTLTHTYNGVKEMKYNEISQIYSNRSLHLIC